MARTANKKEPVKETGIVTRAEKKDAVKNLIRELLAVKPHKHNELLDEASKLYGERFGGEETEKLSDVKGRIGSVLDIMKKESEVAYEGGMYALKARAIPAPAPVETVTETKTAEGKKSARSKKKEEEKPVQEVKTEEKPKRTAKKKAEKKEETPAPTPVVTEEKSAEAKAEELPKKRTRKTKTVEEVKEEKKPQELKAEEKPTVKPKRTAKKKTEEKPVEEVKTEEKTVETPVLKEKSVATENPVQEEKKAEEIPAEKPVDVKTEEKSLVVKEKGEVAKKGVVMDMSFLFGDRKPVKTEKKENSAEKKAEETIVEKKAEKPVQAEIKTEVKVEAKETQPPVKTEKTEMKTGEKPAVKTVEKTVEKPVEKVVKGVPVSELKGKRLVKDGGKVIRKITERPMTADEKLREAFLKRMRSLGGDYFEYYSVYLLERYSMKNGRRLESLKISGGDHDGGIDGEIELTDRFGFKETIYIQSKNWNPEKGDEKLWVVGETLLQQFLGACACRQARDGKQSCRGIFVTTSRFTPDAKRVLETMADKLVGYDGNDVYEAAKECAFGLVKKNGEWALDERLLSGTKAFFNML